MDVWVVLVFLLCLCTARIRICACSVIFFGYTRNPGLFPPPSLYCSCDTGGQTTPPPIHPREPNYGTNGDYKLFVMELLSPAFTSQPSVMASYDQFKFTCIFFFFLSSQIFLYLLRVCIIHSKYYHILSCD